MYDTVPNSLNKKILKVILLTCMIPMIVLSCFTYYRFDVNYTALMYARYEDAVSYLIQEMSVLDPTVETLTSLLDEEQYALFEIGSLTMENQDGTILYEQPQRRAALAQSIAANLEHLRFSRQIPGTDTKITFVVSRVSVESDLYVLRGLLILVILCCGAAACLTAGRLSRTITDPLKDMMEQMERMERGELQVNIAVDTDDEISVLANRFNRLSRELKKHINQVYVAQLHQKDAELNAMRSQITPHFLNNTLEVIRMKAVSENAPETADMIEILSKQMRYTLGMNLDVVTLGTELDFIRNSVKLASKRYATQIELRIECGGLENCLIPKMCLQPLVENAIKYGIRPKQDGGILSITAEKGIGCVEITVLDNGPGMTTEEVNRVNLLLASENPGLKDGPNWKQTGLKNVHDRLRTHYGEPYGVQITSHTGIGTAVCVKIPDSLEETNDVDNDPGRR